MGAHNFIITAKNMVIIISQFNSVQICSNLLWPVGYFIFISAIRIITINLIIIKINFHHNFLLLKHRLMDYFN